MRNGSRLRRVASLNEAHERKWHHDDASRKPHIKNDVDWDKLAAICQQYGIVELSVFGSVARDQSSTASDIDLMYVLAPDARLGWAIGDLEAEFAVVFGRPVDLVSKRAIHPAIRDAVLGDAEILYAA